MRFKTIESIVSDMEGRVGEKEARLLVSDPASTDDSFAKLHCDIELGRFIRNRYGLWHTHPLTEVWRTRPESRNIKNGTDYSKDHPDQVSRKIQDMLVERFKEKYK